MEPDGQTDPVRVRSIHDNRMLAERAFYCFRKIFRVLRQFGRGIPIQILSVWISRALKLREHIESQIDSLNLKCG